MSHVGSTSVHLVDKRGHRICLRRLGIETLAKGKLSEPLLTIFQEEESGLLKVVDRELVIRFAAESSTPSRRAILRRFGLRVLRANLYVPDQFVVFHPAEGEKLVEISNRLTEMNEVLFATPNFASEYRRQVLPSILPQAWHLRDLNAPEAWKITKGKREIVVAVLDDGVDVDHPSLKPALWKNPDPVAEDRIGRDFFLPDDHPDHFNPRPKRFRLPYDDFVRNDIHGTPCAGLIAARGLRSGAVGVASGCRFLPVKIFHADVLASDERVADAIRYAARHADILSCSWSAGSSPDIQQALEDAGCLGRRGRGAAVFCAAGNGFGSGIAFPARDVNAIAVGALTDQGDMADYSNIGPELAFLAPSGGGVKALFTTAARQRGADGLHTNSFSGTSAATALAAGVGALVLSVCPDLGREELKDLLAATSDPRTGNLAARRLNAGRAVAEAARRKG